jgi:hypothetical protein
MKEQKQDKKDIKAEEMAKMQFKKGQRKFIGEAIKFCLHQNKDIIHQAFTIEEISDLVILSGKFIDSENRSQEDIKNLLNVVKPIQDEEETTGDLFQVNFHKASAEISPVEDWSTSNSKPTKIKLKKIKGDENEI